MSATTKHKLWFSFLFLAFVSNLQAQENSPYSRYGFGDLVPNQPILNRGMGGIGAGYVDYDKRYDLKDQYPKSQNVNFLNPASYSKIRITSFNLGFEIDSRTLRSPSQAEKFTASSAIISYLQLGLPLSRKHQVGLNFGLRPLSRINYKIQQTERHAYPDPLIPADSIASIFEGTGGTYEAFAGIGKAFKNFSIGVNAGYFFGTKDYSTRKSILNDTVLHYKSNYETKTSFGGFLFNFGAQYQANINKKTKLVLGAFGNLRQTFNGRQDIVRETFNYDANGAPFPIDTVEAQKDVKGTISYPSNIGIGFTIERLDRWMLGADFTTTTWKDYDFFGVKDVVRNSWSLHVGGQFVPDAFNPKGYWNHVAYRAGFYFGPDYIKAGGKDLNQFGISLGAGLPVRKNPYTNQFSYMNVGFEYGRRGNNNNLLRESMFRITVGFTLSDLWFIKKKYN
ncbi:MAG TPA: hypothetical protein VL307_17630 [Chitinophagaceae bacterium]|nr:hypothetical protein [Chitinophagaceae bacterium]